MNSHAVTRAARAALAFALLLTTEAFTAAQCIEPVGGMDIDADCTFCPGEYRITSTINITSPNITVDGGGATLRGGGPVMTVLRVFGVGGVTVRNLTIEAPQRGIWIEDCSDVLLEDIVVAQSANDASRNGSGDWVGAFLDIFADPDTRYGRAVILSRCINSTVRRITANSQQNGITLANCDNITVEDCTCNDNSGWGLSLYGTSNSTIRNCVANDCFRVGDGYPGGDAASLLIVYYSSNNQIVDNQLRRGGDGVFLSGSRYGYYHNQCNDNYFARNDCSGSPNNGIEATFSERNIFEDNLTDDCNYGYWLGYSIQSEIRGGSIKNCNVAGVAIEHGHQNLIEDNLITNAGRGVWLWSDADVSLVSAWPTRAHSHSSVIRDNIITGCDTGIELAGELDTYRTYGHAVRGNQIDANTDGLYLETVADVRIRDNFIRHNTRYGALVNVNSSHTIFNNYFHNAVNARSYADSLWHTDPNTTPNIVGGPAIGGNYWSNYAGADTDGDGFGDTLTPHIVPGSIPGMGDPYPLTYGFADCNLNAVPDADEIAADPARDGNANGTLDECETFPPGDLNCDGVADTYDIDAFVLALSDPHEYSLAYPYCDRALADCDADGRADTYDIDAFVALVAGD